MRPGLRALALTAVAAITLTGGGVTTASAVRATVVNPAVSGAATTASAPTAQPRRVTLPTGDVVTVSTTPDGRQTASVAPDRRSTAATRFEMFSLAGDLYVVPQSVFTQIGPGQLALSSFDVSRLAGGKRVATRAVVPDFPMQTLTINGVDESGHRDTGGTVLVLNVDNLAKYAGFTFFMNGATKVSVPAGHYAAVADFLDISADAVREVVLPQFTVRGATTITVDARSATSRISVSTPRRATAAITEVGGARTDAVGQTSAYAFMGDPTTAFYERPTTRPVTVGQLHYYVYTRRLSPPGVSPAYTYDVKVPTDGAILADQRYVVRGPDLAAVDSSYAAEHARQLGMDVRFGALPWEFFLFAEGLELTLPTRRTEYYTARPDLSWQGLVSTVFRPSTFGELGMLESSWRSYRPGTRSATTWAGQPQRPRLLQGNLLVGQTICPACVDRAGLDLLAFAFGDNAPDHFGFLDDPSKGLTENVRYRVWVNGARVTSANGMLDTHVRVPAGRKSYRIDYDTHRSSADFRLSTAVKTSWTVPAAAPTSALPAGWVCSFTGSTACTVLPLATAEYALPVDLLGRLRTGVVHGSLGLGHLAGASAVGFTSATVSVSYDGGRTWRPVTVTSEGAGNYRVTFNVPRVGQPNGHGALRITSRDAYGGTFAQTITNAFAVAPA